MYAIRVELSAVVNPADSVKMFVGMSGVIPNTVAASVRSFRPARNSLLVGASLAVTADGGATTETVQMIAENLDSGPTTENIGAATSWAAVLVEYEDSSMSLAVDAGQDLVIAFTGAAWVTNPTSVQVEGWLFFTDDAEAVEVASLVSDQVVDAAGIASNLSNQVVNDSAISANLAAILTNDSDISAAVVATALNTTHRGSIGTDHSNVGLNNTHRTSGGGGDHSDVAQNTGLIQANDSDISSNKFLSTRGLAGR